VRWLEADLVLLAVFERGAVLHRLESDGVSRTVIPEQGRRAGLALTYHVAGSDDYVAAAGPLFAVAWKVRSDEGEVTVKPFAQIVDFDVHEDRIALLGGWRDAKGAWSPDGSIAWTAGLDGAPLRPLFPVADPKLAMGRCGILGLGAVRFLQDGSLVLVPGVEPGVFLFNPKGQRVFTWDTEPLGFFTGCPLDEPEAQLVHADQTARYEWLDRRVVVDEVLPLDDSPGLVIRTATADRVSWELIRLHRDKDPERIPLPFTSDIPYAHLKGDILAENLVFLVYDPFAFRDPSHARATLHFVTLHSAEASP